MSTPYDEARVIGFSIEGGDRGLASIMAKPTGGYGQTNYMLIDDYELTVNGKPATLDDVEAWFIIAPSATVRITRDYGRYGHVTKAEFLG